MWGYQQQHAEQRQRAAQHQASASDQEVQAECVGVTRAHTATCTFHLSQSDDSDARADYDLRAQQDMAEWAFAMFLATIVGLGVTSVGLVYVVLAYRLNASATRYAARAAQAAIKSNRQARDQFLEENRAHIHASFFVFRVYRQPSGGKIKAQGICTITNSGKGIATNVAMPGVTITQDFGPPEDRQLADLVASERNRPLGAGEMLGPQATPIEKMHLFMDVPPECYIAEPFEIGAFNVSGCVRYRFKGAKRYHVVPFVRHVTFSAKDGGDFQVGNLSQGTTVEPD